MGKTKKTGVKTTSSTTSLESAASSIASKASKAGSVRESPRKTPTPTLSTINESAPSSTQATTASVRFESRFAAGSKTKAGGSGKQMHTRAGLVFPCIKIIKRMKHAKFGAKTMKGAGIYMSAVLEYLVAEILELSGNAAHDNHRKRIIPRHLQLAIRNDVELDKLLQDVTISCGGVIPFIHANLLPKKSGGKKKIEDDADGDD